MRLSIDRDALRMFRNKPVLGWGLGTFPAVYPSSVASTPTSLSIEAHNDYLQLLSEMGMLGFGTMVWFLIVLYRHALRKIGNWMSDVSGAVTLACTLGVTGILVHSLLDFNLQVPANAALYSTSYARSQPRHRSCSALASAARYPPGEEDSSPLRKSSKLRLQPDIARKRN